MTCSDEWINGDCIPINPSEPCGAGIRNSTRSCVDGTIMKCADSCGNKTENCTAGTDLPRCASTTSLAPTGMFDSFHRKFY